MVKTLVEIVMEDVASWESQFAHELLRDLERTVENNGWQSLEVWQVIREKLSDYQLTQTPDSVTRPTHLPSTAPLGNAEAKR